MVMEQFPYSFEYQPEPYGSYWPLSLGKVRFDSPDLGTPVPQMVYQPLGANDPDRYADFTPQHMEDITANVLTHEAEFRRTQEAMRSHYMRFLEQFHFPPNKDSTTVLEEDGSLRKFVYPEGNTSWGTQGYALKTQLNCQNLTEMRSWANDPLHRSNYVPAPVDIAHISIEHQTPDHHRRSRTLTYVWYNSGLHIAQGQADSLTPENIRIATADELRLLRQEMIDIHALARFNGTVCTPSGQRIAGSFGPSWVGTRGHATQVKNNLPSIQTYINFFSRKPLPHAKTEIDELELAFAFDTDVPPDTGLIYKHTYPLKRNVRLSGVPVLLDQTPEIVTNILG